MILSAPKKTNRFLTVLPLIFLFLSCSLPLLHAHAFGHGSNKLLPHGSFETHFTAGHVDDHDHQNNILDEQFVFTTDFHTHDAKSHTHKWKNILNICRVNKSPARKITPILQALPPRKEPDKNIETKKFEAFYNSPDYKDKTATLSFTDLPPPLL